MGLHMEWTEPQSRLVEVSSSRVQEALVRWWSIETRFLEAMREAGHDAPARSVDLAAERRRLEVLTAATRTRLPGVPLPRPRRARSGRAGRPEALDSGQQLLGQSRAVSVEVSNLRDLFHEWEQADLVVLMGWALDLHRRIERGLAMAVGTEGGAPGQEEKTRPPVRYIAGVPRGPVTPWGQGP